MDFNKKSHSTISPVKIAYTIYLFEKPQEPLRMCQKCKQRTLNLLYLLFRGKIHDPIYKWFGVVMALFQRKMFEFHHIMAITKALFPNLPPGGGFGDSLSRITSHLFLIKTDMKQYMVLIPYS